jgi:hypothetical protein
MFSKFRGHLSKVKPSTALVGALIGVLVIAGAAVLLTRTGSKAEAAMQPFAARVDRVDGSVGIARMKADNNQTEWSEATVNTPVTVGDRIYARDGASAAIALSGHNYVRLNPETAVDVLTLTDRRTQVALRSGSALFDVGALSGDDFYEVATPCGAVDFRQPGLYQVGMDGNNAIISVLSGLAQVVGLEGSGLINKGQVYTLYGTLATEAFASTLAPDVAGGIVDGYYRERYSRIYDGRYRNYNTYLEDPYFYDPYRSSVSYQYLPADIPGLYDLDYYGDWSQVSGYGHCWAPRVSSGWAPFRSGYWDLNDVWGPSWVSSEPWGWAPYHYGRWAFVSQRWYWVPSEVTTYTYAPATVAFIPYADQLAWVPLGPGEAYVPRYYDDYYQPQYLASSQVINVASVQRTFVNYDVPGGLTVVPVRSLTGVIDPTIISTVDPRVVLQTSRPVLDPFSVAGVRQLATSGEDRRRFRVERREQEAFNRSVVASTVSDQSPVRRNLSNALNVEAVPAGRRENKLKVRDAGQAAGSVNSGGTQRMSELASRAQQGDKSARREMRRLMREEVRTGNQPGATQSSTQQLSRQQLKEQRRAERQQQAGGPQPPAAQQSQRQQMKEQRRAARQQQSGVPQQQSAQQSQRQQMKEQRKAARPQQSGVPQQQSAQQSQRQQMKEERKAARQRPPQQQAAQQSQRQQMREQRRAAIQQQAAASQQQAVRQAQRQQMKEQKRAARPQQMAQPQVAAPQAQRQQMKEQRRFERQQQVVRPPVAAPQVQRQQMKEQRSFERQQQQVFQPQVAARQVQRQQQQQIRQQQKDEKRAARQNPPGQ